MSLLRALSIRLINLVLILLVVLIIISAVLSGPASQILKSNIERQASEQVTQLMLHHPMTPAQADQLRQKIINQLEAAYGLNQPLVVRVFFILYNIMSFNWGFSYFPSSYGVPSGRVVSIIMSALPGTVILDTLGIMLSALIGIWLGLRAALKYGTKYDRAVTYYGAVDNGIPQWWVAILMILVFAVDLRLMHSPVVFPYGGIVSSQYYNVWLYNPLKALITPQILLNLLYHMVLPMATVLIVNVGGWAYFARSIVLNIAKEDYVFFARIKGLPQGQVVSRYIMRPAMPQILTSIFITIPFVLFGGFLLTEAVFHWWGLGYVLNIAIVGVPSPDMPVILAVTYMSTLLYIILVFILEILYYVLDPRIREGVGG
ncbi:ABC transporter permease [Caldivirga maquilingensis]|uniref:Binding-protein-dependent transport systems inner membrane component n=1 Tax=Caldivirga maquilingensis (strain ATCC 700844 / DSM 13496 / JCM 10307 / IC-167) TaxID=397948 RepID=A8MCY0_CALMQ|nr:ABC transporter permease [Caldivirga maquilingensis]ABW01636.1 binding-protein-dependent transport systems inner membrane component [Caldivirga maquilingensis IC-167]